MSPAWRQVMHQRLCKWDNASPALDGYIHKNFPIDESTNARITGNPLMLSMVIAIFETGLIESGTEGNDIFLDNITIEKVMPRELSELCTPLPKPVGPRTCDI